MFTLHLVKIALVGIFIGVHIIFHQMIETSSNGDDDYEGKTTDIDNVRMGQCDMKVYMKLLNLEMKIIKY